MRTIRTRPLVVAGAASVAGVLLGLEGALWAAPALLLIVPLRRQPVAWLAMAALIAGLVAGGLQRHRTLRALAACARGPPQRGIATLAVERAGEDPFERRAWLAGRRADGTGVLCSWPGALPAGVGPGASVRVAGRFFSPRRATNPGEEDAAVRLAERGISVLGRLRAEANLEVLRAAPRDLRGHLARARRAALARVRAVLPADVAPVVAALVLGVRQGIAFEDRVLFERTGTMHLLAISGMHLLLLAGLLHAALRRLGCGPRLAAGATLAAALLYLPLTGAAPPIRRATTVLVFYALALVRGRPPDAASALGGAAAFLALHDPAGVSSVGFRLTFAAAAGIVLLAPPWQDRLGARHRLLARFPAVRKDRPLRLAVQGYLVRSLPVSAAAWCSTQALVAHAFGTVTPLAVATNVAVGPLLVLLLPAAALLVAGVSFLAAPVTGLCRALRALLDCADGLPGGYLFVADLPLAALLPLLLAVALLRSRPRRALLLAAAGVVLGAAPQGAGAGLHLLDVGHGQAALVRLEDGGAILVDGGSRGRREVGRRVLLPALRALGVRRLEAVVCTHADGDHWNGLPEVLARVPTARLIVGSDPPPALLAGAGARTPVVRAFAGLRLGGGGMRILAAGSGGSRNDCSLALLIESRGGRVLLPADREEPGLSDLLPRLRRPCDLLVAPHHGARCRFAQRFGAAVRAHTLLVSGTTGFSDRRTLAAYGATRTLETALLGCLVVDLRDLSVRAYASGTPIRRP